MDSRPRLFLLDANALLHRAWHAIPPLTRPDGKVVNAVYGVLMSCMKLLKDERPDAFIACWDTEAPTFRHQAYKEYKGQREEQPDELYDQIPWIQEGLATLRIPSLFLDGYEADDVIGTFALRGKKAGWDVVIVTSDRDAFQLIQPGISIMVFKKGVTETAIMNEEALKADYGLTPGQFLEYKAMRGDPSDNIPGIRGIGEKGAVELLQSYGSLDAIYLAAHDTNSVMKAGVRQKLLSAEHEVPAIMKLVTIVTDVPLDWVPASCHFDAIDEELVRGFLLKFGFKTLLSRIPGSVPLKVKSHALESGSETKQDQTMLVHRVSDSHDAQEVCQKISQASEIVIRVSRGTADSLFASVIDGVVIGTRQEVFTFSKTLLTDERVHAEVQALLSNTAIRKIGHDVKQEMHDLTILHLTVREWTFDTMLAAYLLNAGERNYDLPNVTMRYVQRVLPATFTATQGVEAVLCLLDVMRFALEKDGLHTVLARFEMPLIPVLYDMERWGILIDKPYLSTLSTTMTREKEALETRMRTTVGRDFNPASPTQLAVVLFDDLKLPTKRIKQGKTGYSTAASELEKLRGLHPLIEMIEDYRELSKLLSTYVDVLPGLIDAHGRVHTTYHQAVAATGRLSSTDPNLQNIPIRTEVGRKIRRGFIAEKGYVLLSCDYSQIELRLVAVLAKDQQMLAAFDRGADIHTATAAHIWKIEPAEVTKEQRRIAKAINFGLIFGQGAQGLAAVAGISSADAKKFITAYFDVYQGIKNYMTETRTRAHQLGYVETLFGRRRYVPDILSSMPQVRAQAERMAINMPVQGTDADLMKLAMIQLSQTLPIKFPQARMLLQVHDELVFEVLAEEVVSVSAFVKKVMETIEPVGVPIIVEAKTGLSWDEMKKIS